MSTNTYREIAPEDAYRARDKARLIDVREAAELARDGFIPGAVNVPLTTVEAQARMWDKDDELVVICRSGARSTRAATALAAMGFRRVTNMTGGMLAYLAAGLPVARS
jgi:sulfur-carrier protein adenylyltransferase/sulfurtransferase